MCSVDGGWMFFLVFEEVVLFVFFKDEFVMFIWILLLVILVVIIIGVGVLLDLKVLVRIIVLCLFFIFKFFMKSLVWFVILKYMKSILLRFSFDMIGVVK